MQKTYTAIYVRMTDVLYMSQFDYLVLPFSLHRYHMRPTWHTTILVRHTTGGSGQNVIWQMPAYQCLASSFFFEQERTFAVLTKNRDCSQHLPFWSIISELWKKIQHALFEKGEGISHSLFFCLKPTFKCNIAFFVFLILAESIADARHSKLSFAGYKSECFYSSPYIQI